MEITSLGGIWKFVKEKDYINIYLREEIILSCENIYSYKWSKNLKFLIINNIIILNYNKNIVYLQEASFRIFASENKIYCNKLNKCIIYDEFFNKETYGSNIMSINNGEYIIGDIINHENYKLINIPRYFYFKLEDLTVHNLKNSLPFMILRNGFVLHIFINYILIVDNYKKIYILDKLNDRNFISRSNFFFIEMDAYYERIDVSNNFPKSIKYYKPQYLANLLIGYIPQELCNYIAFLILEKSIFIQSRV